MPAPAGAMTTVSGHHRLPCAISLVIRGRGTTQPGTPGAVILAATIGTPADTAGLPPQAATCLATRTAIGTSVTPSPPSDRQVAGGEITRSAAGGCRLGRHARPA